MLASDSKTQNQNSTVCTNYRNYLCNNIIWNNKLDSFVVSMLLWSEAGQGAGEAQDKGGKQV